MSPTAEAISLLLTLVQTAGQAAQAATEIGALIQKANSEGREITEGELDAARGAAIAARERLVG